MSKYQNSCVLSEYPFNRLPSAPIDADISKINGFKSLSATHIDSIYRFALYMTGSKCDAQNLVLHTYIKAYKNYNGLINELNYKIWLLKISRDTLMKLVLCDDMLTCPSVIPNNKEYIEQTYKNESSEMDLEDDVDKAIYSLPTEYRMAVILADIEEFSYKEICYIMDCPIETMASNLYKGRQILKEKLGST